MPRDRLGAHIRRFNGKIFHLSSRHKTKQHARDAAALLRHRGAKGARVVKAKGGYNTFVRRR